MESCTRGNSTPTTLELSLVNHQFYSCDGKQELMFSMFCIHDDVKLVCFVFIMFYKWLLGLVYHFSPSQLNHIKEFKKMSKNCRFFVGSTRSSQVLFRFAWFFLGWIHSPLSRSYGIFPQNCTCPQFGHKSDPNLASKLGKLAKLVLSFGDLILLLSFSFNLVTS